MPAHVLGIPGLLSRLWLQVKTNMKTKLVGDIGATSGKWVVRDDNGIRQFTTPGYNPSSQSGQLLSEMIRQLEDNLPTADEIWYYGTGVNSEPMKDLVEHGLHTYAPGAEVSVDSDLLGAARATCGDKPSVICILGTGSNAGIYDGSALVRTIHSLGYPIGDEGSGWRIGAALTAAHYYGNMPGELSDAFAQMLPLARDEFLKTLRSSIAPNRYLASFATFAAERKSNPWIANIIRRCFVDFTEIHLRRMTQSGPVSFVGSIATGFQEILREVMEHYKIDIGVIVSDSLDGLTNYHLKRS